MVSMHSMSSIYIQNLLLPTTFFYMYIVHTCYIMTRLWHIHKIINLLTHIYVDMYVRSSVIIMCHM